MSYKKKVLSNVVYNFLAFLAISVSGYVFWIILGNYLLPGEYGVVSFIIALFSFLFPISTLGGKSPPAKFISEFVSKKETSKIKPLVWFSVKVTIFLSLLLGILTTVFLLFFGSYFGIVVGFESLIYLIVPMLLFGSLMQIGYGVLMGFQEFKSIFYSNAIAAVIKIIMTFGLAYLLFGGFGGIISFIVWSIVSFVSMFFYMRKKLPKISENFDKSKFISYGKSAMFSGLMIFLITQGPLIFLPLISTMESVGFFRVAVLFGMIIQFPAFFINPALMPSISNFWSSGKKERATTFFNITMKYLFITLLPIVMLVAVFSRFIVSLIYRPEYLLSVPFIFPYLLGSFFFSIILLIINFFFYTDEPKRLVQLSSLSAITNIILIFILVPMFDAIGASYAFLVSQIIVTLISCYLIGKKIKFDVKNLIKITLIVIPFSILIYIIKLVFNNIVYTSISVVISVLLLFLLFLKLRIFDVNDIKFLETIPDLPILLNIKQFLISVIKNNM